MGTCQCSTVWLLSDFTSSPRWLCLKTLRFEKRNMMLVWVLVVTALLVSDVAGTNNSLVLKRTQRDLQNYRLFRGPCEENWFHFPLLNSCYRFFSDKKAWMAAENFCNQDAYCGQLTSVNSDEHNTFISNVISIVDQKKPWAWIGLNDIYQEGTFTWVDGTACNYTRWDVAQPDDYQGNEDCAHIHLSGYAGFDKSLAV
ncbi:echinoidin-like [Mobula hypostoma]|uniref:echinoidin-like n=1 Tax=Mobula hypostoma TaxID=723540 RepID=UPI002FC3996A